MRRLAALLLCAIALMPQLGRAQNINASPSGGGTQTWVLISQQVVSGAASLQWTGLGSTYSDYVIICSNAIPVTDATSLLLQFGEGGTPTWQTSGYNWSGVQVNSSGTTVSGAAGASASGIDLNLGTIRNSGGNGQPMTGEVWIHNVPSTSLNTAVEFSTYSATAGTSTHFTSGTGALGGDTTAKTGIRIIPSSGNENATCTLWGILE